MKKWCMIYVNHVGVFAVDSNSTEDLSNKCAAARVNGTQQDVVFWKEYRGHDFMQKLKDVVSEVERLGHEVSYISIGTALNVKYITESKGV